MNTDDTPLDDAPLDGMQVDDVQVDDAGAPADQGKGSAFVAWFRRHGHKVLLIAGTLAVGLLIHSVGWDAVLGVLAQAGPWIPVLLVLEALWVGTESLALWFLLKPEPGQISFRRWMRALMSHYIVMAVVPAGRAAGEVARVTVLAPAVGAAKAGACATLTQGCALLGNALITIPCILIIAKHVGFGDKLTLLLFGNLAATFIVGSIFYHLPRRLGIGSKLSRRIKGLKEGGPAFDAALRAAPAIPIKSVLAALAARCVQTLQYGLMLLAVGGGFSWDGTWISEGIHLVGAFLGDFVPNQMGVTEGAYRAFADTLGLGDAPERALSIALLARLVIFMLVGIFFALLRTTRPASAERESGGA